MSVEKSILRKLKYAAPWLLRYPFSRAKGFFDEEPKGKRHLIFTIANHFEPAWKDQGLHDLDTQRRRLDEWIEFARKTGEAVRDEDGTKFRHTNFYPAEQYDRRIIDQMAALQKEGLGDVEIHLHHGIDKPDTEVGLRQQLLEFRDRLAEDHKCLSRIDGQGMPMYAFVHGNWALANSHGGAFCGVDNELQILQETGCYVDMTLPSAPDRTQVPMLNKIYECGLPLKEKMAHRKGRSVAVGKNSLLLPLIFTGPLAFDWNRRIRGIPVPRLDEGSLVYNQPMNLARLDRWICANVTVKGQPDWIFIKLHCHGFFDPDLSACIGDSAREFFSQIIEQGQRSGNYSLHFATAREAFNIVWAAIDGHTGSPGRFRNYKLKSIMDEE